MKPTRAHSIRKTCIYLAIVGVIVMFCLELFVRFYLVGPAAFSPAVMGSFRPIGYTHFVRRADNETICFEFVPNSSGFYHLVPLDINADGLRDRDYARAKPPDTFRIAVLGDSFTMGANVPLEDTYTKRLENLLNATAAGVHYEVINFAGAGYDTGQELEVLRTKAAAYDPDLVLVGFVLNDIRVRPDCTFQRKNNPLFHSYLYNLCYIIWGRLTLPKGRLRDSEGSPEAWAYVEEQFAGLQSFAAVSGVPILLTVFPYMESLNEQYPYRILHDRVADRARAHGLPVLDLLPAFMGRNEKEFWSYKIDHHPNAKAHAIFAEEIHRWFGSRGLVGSDTD